LEKTITYGNETVYYRVEGTGMTLFFIHGFPETGSIWTNQVEFLKKQFRVIVPDIPGSGRSTFNAALVNMGDYADVMNAIIEHEKLEQVIMFGHSMGGYITLSFAEKYPSLLKAFGLVHSTAFADSEEKKQNRQRGIDFMETHGAFPFIKNSIPNLFSKPFQEAFPDTIASLVEQGKSFDKKALQQYYRAMMNRKDKTEVLRKTDVPVLFICGDEDTAAPLSDLKQQIHLPACSHFHILNHVAHMSMLEAPGLLNDFLLAFILN
jgi:pimeloyl-ACP methyl ester carboxylesterase